MIPIFTPGDDCMAVLRYEPDESHTSALMKASGAILGVDPVAMREALEQEEVRNQSRHM